MSQDSQRQYYMVVNEQQTGPYTLEEIIQNDFLTPETLVWKPGYENWVAAKTLPELAEVFETLNPPQDFNTPPQYNTARENNFQDRRFENNPQYQSNHSYGNQNRYGGNQYQQSPYEQDPYRHHDHYHPRNNNPYPSRFHTNWMPWAIVATVLGFFTSCIGIIFGIIAIVQSNKANNFYAQGMDREGDAANSNAKTMTIIGLVFAGIGIIASIWVGNILSNMAGGAGNFWWF